MAWRTRVLELDGGTRVEVECGEARCCLETNPGWQECPALTWPRCLHFKRGRNTTNRPLACKRAEEKAQKSDLSGDKSRPRLVGSFSGGLNPYR